MDCPRRRAAATVIAALLGAGGLAAQDVKTPMAMPPRAAMPAAGTSLPPTGTPVGTPIPGGLPPGTRVHSIPTSPGPTFVSDAGLPAPLPTAECATPVFPAAPAPYFGYYPTQWRAFPEMAFPAGGQPLPTYPPVTISPAPPPLLKAITPNPLPFTAEAPPKSNVLPVGGPEPITALPPLFASEDVSGPDVPFAPPAPPAPKPAASMGRPRLSSAPEPVAETPFPAIMPSPAPQPMATPGLLPASASEISFTAAPVVPAVAVSERPLTVRPPVAPERPRFR